MKNDPTLRQARLRLALRVLIAAAQADRELTTDENWIIASSRIIHLLGAEVEGESKVETSPISPYRKQDAA